MLLLVLVVMLVLLLLLHAAVAAVVVDADIATIANITADGNSTEHITEVVQGNLPFWVGTSVSF